MDSGRFNQYKILRTLLSVTGIGPASIIKLASEFGSLEDIAGADYTSLVTKGRIKHDLANSLLDAFHDTCRLTDVYLKDAEYITAKDYRTITYWDKDYPRQLKNIFIPPVLLYSTGPVTEEDRYGIAIVGTRMPTEYGKIQAESFAAQLALQNVTVVSGMARGIDSAAHWGAVKSGGRTIAVLGSGIDVVYPPENRKLFDEIKERGTVLTEYDPGTKPDAQNFPKRNRIISGISLGTLIVETREHGGALQTAAFALDQNREVFAVPGNISSKQSEGTNLLIQKGEAKLVLNADDILNELELKLKPVIGKTIPKPDVELSLFEQKIMEKLTADPTHIDKLAELTGASVSDCLVYLLQLEFKGLIKQLPGKNFCVV